MTPQLIGLIGFIATFVLMFMRVPIVISMIVPSFLGILILRNWDWKLLQAVSESFIWEHSFSYTLSTIPMFILMGELLLVAGLTNELFSSFRSWFGRLKGGLAMATIGASSIFAASSGSSIATTGTMGLIASKEMLNSGYNKSLAAGAILAGGSLGILIPPSTTFIIYGMLSEQSIGKLFLAGILPGIVLTLFYLITVYISVTINPALAPKWNSVVTWKERFVSLKSTVWIMILFVVVIGGIYLGIFSPNEAGGVGAFGAFIIALARKKLTWRSFVKALLHTLQTTGFLFAIVLSSFILNYFLAITRIPNLFAEFLINLELSKGLLFAVIILMYIFLGAVLDAMAMIVITIPIVLPVIQALGFDLIWFGVILVLVVEMALISPPIGMACFVLNGVEPDFKLENIFKGAIRFMLPIIALVMVLYFFPEIALYIPNTM